VVIAQVLHSLHKTKTPGVIVKLDYEKAYNRVNLEFLLEILVSRGFGDRWIGWITKIILGGSVSVVPNGEESPTFKTGKGVRQGGALSPLLFNLVGDVMTRMLSRAANNKLIKDALDQFRPGSIVSLQYTDDTLLFSNSEVSYLKNLKIILALFERICGMRTNFHKSEFIPLHLEEDMVHEIGHSLS
jgi:hypothetical protein